MLASPLFKSSANHVLIAGTFDVSHDPRSTAEHPPEVYAPQSEPDPDPADTVRLPVVEDLSLDDLEILD
ncbi:MAG: hypothetical protein AAF799_14535 [Myxococcota bacterium]